MTNHETEEIFDMPEYEQSVAEYETVCIAPEGVGYGDGSISAKRENHPDFPVTPEQLHQAVEVLIANIDRVLVPVEEDDDGCGDGRPTRQVFRVIDSGTGGAREFFKKSKNRAKVFGGGLQVMGSMWRVVSGVPQHEETVLDDRKFVAGEAKKRSIKYGAHTDTHASGQNCGCGACDKYRESIVLSGEYQPNIAATLPVFYGDAPIVDMAITRAFAARETVARIDHYMSDVAGRMTMDFMERDGALIKELDGPHLESLILLNDEEGKSLDQNETAMLFREHGLPEGIQVFTVDIWRGRMYASAVADMATEHIAGTDHEDAERVSFADFCINTMAVATALTDGTLPVIRHQMKSPAV